MQQTDRYKLNLIESSDPFLLDGLNENTRRLEQVMSQHLDAMDQRIAVFEAKHLAYGSYIGQGGTGKAATIPLSFTPKAVFVGSAGNSNFAFTVEGGYVTENGGIIGSPSFLAENGFTVLNDLNNGNVHYNYIALG